MIKQIAVAVISLSVLCTVSCSSSTRSSEQSGSTSQGIGAHRAHDHHGAIHNLHQLNDRLYSGAEPVGEEAYEELASLGITTVISVDAVPPNKALAEKHNIRVIHLPIGYDGVPEDRGMAIGKALAAIKGPVFVNCHHGKHRAPAALAVGAVCAGEISNEQAESYLTLAGTSHNYPGLWDAAKHAQTFDHAALEASDIELPEVMPVGDFVDAMGALDRINDTMWDLEEIDFRVPADHPDIVPAALAGQMHNILRTLENDPYTLDQDDEFRSILIASIVAASDTEEHIKQGNIDGAREALQRLEDSCVKCHKQSRNDH